MAREFSRAIFLGDIMKIFYLCVISLILTACAGVSPTDTMTPEQISSLSDERLCSLQSHYDFEPKLEVEIGKRDIECTEEFLSCKRQGYIQKTPQFENCKQLESMKNMAGDLTKKIINANGGLKF